MCGRFTLTPEPSAILQAFPGLVLPPGVMARYNVAPSNKVLAVTAACGEPAFEMLSWGLVPSWAKDARIGNSLINARAESIDVKPAFRSAFRARRGLVVADGFYEWRTEGRRKRPYYFRLASGEVFAFGGLWETWWGAGAPLRSCCLITTDANAVVAPVHDRMPVIVPRAAYDAWLDPSTSPETLRSLLAPYPPDEMVGWEVSSLVSSPRNDSPACIAPLDDGGAATPADQGGAVTTQVETLDLF